MRYWNLVLAASLSILTVALIALMPAHTPPTGPSNSTVPPPQVAQRQVSVVNASEDVIVIGGCLPKISWSETNTTLVVICPPSTVNATSNKTITPYAGG